MNESYGDAGKDDSNIKDYREDFSYVESSSKIEGDQSQFIS